MRRVLVAAVALSLGCMTSGALGAQSDPAALDRLEAEIERGTLEGARASLETWIAGASGASAEVMGRARYLRARLMADVDSARAEYLAVAVEGRSSYGARAWLRLAQLDLAVGEPMRAVADLERLRADYPSDPIARTSWYWTARALEQRGMLEEACDNFERAVGAAGEAGADELRDRAMLAADSCSAAGLRFSIQVGAFSRPATARELAEQLDEEGFPARVFEEGGLHRVRVGRFVSPETARGLERRLRDGGFTVAVVAAES